MKLDYPCNCCFANSFTPGICTQTVGKCKRGNIFSRLLSGIWKKEVETSYYCDYCGNIIEDKYIEFFNWKDRG